MVSLATGKPVGRIARWARYGYLSLAWLFVLWVVAQVFLIGLSFFTTAGFTPHIEFGHTFTIFILLMFLVALIARLPWRIVLLTVLLFVLYSLQYVFVDVARATGAGWVFAFHPTNALLLFWLGLFLARRARQFTSGAQALPARAEVNVA